MSDQFDPYYTWLGIPPEEQPPDHYRLLGIRRFENNPEVISNVLGQRLAHVRSLQSGERAAAAQHVLRELVQAGDCLTSAELKGAYDRELRQKDAPKLGRPQAAPQFSRPAAMLKSSPKVPAAVAQPPAGPVVFTEVARRPVSSPVPWPLILLVGGGSVVALLGGVVLVAVLYGAGLFSNKPTKGPPIAEKPPEVKPKDPEPVKEPINVPGPGQETRPSEITKPPTPAKLPSDDVPVTPLPSIGTFALAPIVANAGPPLDLFKDFDSQKQVARGEVRKHPGGWQTVGSAPQDILVFPVSNLPAEYVVETTVVRTGDTNNDGLLQGLVVGDRQCLVTVDGYKPVGIRTALESIDDKRAGGFQDACEHRGKLLATNTKAILKYYVFRDRLAVECNGKTILNWTGGLHRLSLDGQFSIGDSKALFFGAASGSFVLTSFDVRPLGPLGGPPPVAIAGNLPKIPASEPTPVVPEPVVKSPAPEPTPKETRLALPEEEALKESLKRIREIYKARFKLTLPGDKADLAETLLNVATDEAEPATLYTCLTEARRLKVELVDTKGAFLVVDKLLAKFALDSGTEKTETLKSAMKAALKPGGTLPDRRFLAEVACRLTEENLDAARFKAAGESATVASSAAEKWGDTKQKTEARALKRSADAAMQQQTAYDDAVKKLKATPDDAEANEICGKFLCLTKRDWKQGLPHLVKANSAALKEAAVRDAAAPTEAADQIALAGLWWQLAAPPMASREQDSLKLRARLWYQRAEPTAVGLGKAQAAQRLSETAELAGEFAAEVHTDPSSWRNLRRQINQELYVEIVGSARGTVYGTDIYTDDSSLETAAVHAGLLKDGEKGIVKVTILPGQASYARTTRNGVTSTEYGSWSGSFKVETAPRIGIRLPVEPKKRARPPR